MDDERADEQRRRHVAGDAEGEERDEAGRDHRTVGGFGSSDALKPALAEGFGLL